MELAQDCVQWWALVLVVLNFWVLPPEYEISFKGPKYVQL
jgi:hypothetical protein